MTRNVATWDRDIGMPRRNWASLWRAACGPGRYYSPIGRMRVADLDERMLRDIGFEPQSALVGTGARLGGRGPRRDERAGLSRPLNGDWRGARQRLPRLHILETAHAIGRERPPHAAATACPAWA